MPLDPDSLALFDALQTGKLTRRQFARRLAALGFASSSIATFLAACGAPAPSAAPAGPPTVAPTALPAVRPTVPVPVAAPTSPPAQAAPAAAPAPPASADLGRLASAAPHPNSAS